MALFLSISYYYYIIIILLLQNSADILHCYLLIPFSLFPCTYTDVSAHTVLVNQYNKLHKLLGMSETAEN